jgi:hypothetical protein
VCLFKQWQKGRDSLAQKLVSDPLLMPRHGMNRIPIDFLRREA